MNINDSIIAWTLTIRRLHETLPFCLQCWEILLKCLIQSIESARIPGIGWIRLLERYDWRAYIEVLVEPSGPFFVAQMWTKMPAFSWQAIANDLSKSWESPREPSTSLFQSSAFMPIERMSAGVKSLAEFVSLPNVAILTPTWAGEGSGANQGRARDGSNTSISVSKYKCNVNYLWDLSTLLPHLLPCGILASQLHPASAPAIEPYPIMIPSDEYTAVCARGWHWTPQGRVISLDPRVTRQYPSYLQCAVPIPVGSRDVEVLTVLLGFYWQESF